jgi:predicted nucleic acid-binding protein
MTRWYLDTSAATKLCVLEVGSVALAEAVIAADVELVAGDLLVTELRRATLRRPEIEQTRVTRLLETVTLYRMEPRVFHAAGLLPGPGLRSLDALHLATALQLGVDAVLTYDNRMAAAAREFGLPSLSPS